MAQIQIGEKNAAAEAIRSALPIAAQTKDHNKLLHGHRQLAELSKEKGDIDTAKKELNSALRIAEQTKNTDAKKLIKEQIRDLR